MTPVYNGERHVGITLESVRAQTFQLWEHVVVDDGSTDASAAVAERCAAADDRVRLIRRRNGGSAAARNAGFAATRASEYVMFLDHDDVLEPDMLETAVAYLDEHPAVGVVYTGFVVIDEEGRRSPQGWDTRYRTGTLRLRRIAAEEPDTPFETLLMWGGILPSNSLIRRSVYERVGGFDDRWLNDDTDLFMRLGLQAPVHRINRPLVSYRRHAGQMSADSTRTHAELDRLLAEKWMTAALPQRDRRRFERGMSLRTYGADALVGLSAAGSNARAGKYVTAGRFLAGAARRYLLYVAANVGLFRARAQSRNGATD